MYHSLLFTAVYDITKSTMCQTDEYDLQFIRYLLSSHAENICCLTSISGDRNTSKFSPSFISDERAEVSGLYRACFDKRDHYVM